MPFGEEWDDDDDAPEDEGFDAVQGWLIKHPNLGRPRLTEELLDEMDEDAVAGGYSADDLLDEMDG